MAGASDLSSAKRALLERALRGGAVRPEAPAPIAGRPEGRPARLSIGQEQLWFFSRLSPELGVYNEGATLRRRGPVDLDAFRRAFSDVVRRHEIWRTTFPTVDGVPVQRVHPPRPFELPLTDLTHLPPARREAEAVRLATADAREPYDLAEGPLVRARLTRLADDDHRLYLALHHIVFDGVSLYRVLLPEIVALYEAHAAGRAPDLPEPAVQYADYAEWQQAQWERPGPAVAARLDYWRRQLAGVPPAQLPADRERPPVQRFRGAVEHLVIERELAGALRALATRHGCTLFMALAAAFTVLLQRYSGQDDVVFGTPIDDRGRPELQSMIGFCLNAVVLRVDAGGDPTFEALLARAREVTLAGLTTRCRSSAWSGSSSPSGTPAATRSSRSCSGSSRRRRRWTPPGACTRWTWAPARPSSTSTWSRTSGRRATSAAASCTTATSSTRRRSPAWPGTG